MGWSNDWIDAGRDIAVAREDKPVVHGVVSAVLLRRAALLAVVACVILSLATGWLAGATHLAAVASAWAYNLVLKSTALSWLPYAVSFGLLPVFVVLASEGGRATAGWAVLATALDRDCSTGEEVRPAAVIPRPVAAAITDADMRGRSGPPSSRAGCV